MALQYAIAGMPRAANTRSGYIPVNRFFSFTINGTDRTRFTSRYESMIHDQLNEVPNTASVMVRGFTPSVGQTITITLNTTSAKLFDGIITQVEQVQSRTGTRLRYRLECIDWTFLLNQRLVSQDFGTQAANLTVAAIMATFTTGFTTTNLEAGLSSVEFSCKMETVSQALTRLANLAGAFWYIDYDKDLHFRITENLTNPATLDTTNKTFSRLKYTANIQQVRTRVLVEGGGVTALNEVTVGDTILPVETAAWYDASGGGAVAGPQRLTYTSVTTGGGGSLVGSGGGPTVAPTLALAVGAGLGTGVYQYGYTFVTAAGESLPSPLGTITTNGLTPGPTQFNSYTPGLGIGGLVPGTTYEYACAWSKHVTVGNHSQETPVGALVGIVALADGGGGSQFNQIDIPFSSDPTVLYVYVYRRVSAGAYHYLGARANPDATGGTPVSDGTSDAAIAGNPAPSNTLPAGRQVTLTGIALGPSGTTQRKLYRTVVAGAQLKLQQTVANNTVTVGVTDVTADGSLGANVPTSDTSGLSFANGQVNAGSTSLVTTSAGPFSASGGWVQLGSQFARYTGVSGNTLTGIPASGVGAILTTALYGSPAIPAPSLNGIPASGAGSIQVAIKQGDPINLLVTVDDVAAQTALAAQIGGDGIIEHYIQDRRLSVGGATARGTAELTLGKDPDEVATVTSEDVNVYSGRSLTIGISGIAKTLKIQQVRIYWTVGRRMAQRDVTATNRFKTFYQFVRDIEAKASQVV